jgi:L-ribulose-5-phosphate 3-epimerase
MSRLGVMQGRLLPKFEGRYQAHPKGYWQAEYALAGRLGLDCIEFILDFDGAEENPLLCEGGAEEICQVGKASGVSTVSVCADYFMIAPLHSPEPAIVVESQRVLTALISAGEMIGLSDIVVPCVDESTLRDHSAADRLMVALEPLIPVAETAGVNLCLETDLAPIPFGDLLKSLDSPRVTANYDMGNSASLGYDVEEEMASYGHRVSDIHIKDRTLGGGSVILGTGVVDFDRVFGCIADLDFHGPFVLQAFRDDEGVVMLEQQLEWLRPAMAPWIGTVD